MTTPILVIVETISSQQDRNGNRYHFARFYSTARGRQASVTMEVDGESNARAIAYELAGKDLEAMLYFEREVSKTEWKRLRQGVTYCEGGLGSKAALAALFAVEG